MSIFKHTRLTYGLHAVHLSANQCAPIFWPRPNVDNTFVHGSYEYEHDIDPTRLEPQPFIKPIGISGQLSNYRQDTIPHHTKREKFGKQGLDLYAMLLSTISLSSKMSAQRLRIYLLVVQTNCLHLLLTTLAASLSMKLDETKFAWILVVGGRDHWLPWPMHRYLVE